MITMVNSCADNELIIGGTIFPHKNCHKVSWVSPDFRTENQIDHFLISRKWRRSLLDVRNRRGADIGSDHHLMIARIRIKIAAIKKHFETRKMKYDVGKLKNEHIKQQFKLELKNKFDALSIEGDDIEEHWFKIKDALVSTAEDVIGFRSSKRKVWMTSNTWDLIEQRRMVKMKLIDCKTRNKKVELQTAYKNKDREVKKSVRSDRKKWISDLAQRAEKAANTGNMKELYDITRMLANKKNIQSRPVRSKDGNILTSEEAKLNRWREHFIEILNRVECEEDIQEREEDDEIRGIDGNVISSEPPSKKEINIAIKQLRSGKAPGIDNIAPELLLVDPESVTNTLHPLFEKIWNTESLPTEWSEGLLVKLPKKGDVTNCNNWRGIALLSNPSKVLMRIILNRIKESMDEQLREEQAGFRSNRSCIDHINTLRIIVEQSQEFISNLYLLFIDFEKAFDSINRNSMWRVLQKYGIPRKIINIIKETYNKYRCRVIHDGKVTEPFSINSGVRQGCILSPTIFLLVMDDVMKKVTEEKKRGIQWGLTERLEDLDYADDICLLAQKYVDMEEKFKDLEYKAKKVGLKVNPTKTKLMKVNTKDRRNIRINGENIEDVKEFSYLGSIISQDGGAVSDVKSRIHKANAVFIQLYPLWKSREITTKTKLRIFRSNVKSVLLYGCETWKVTAEITRSLQVFLNRCLRKILRIFWPNIISNENLWKQTNEEPVQIQIKRRKWRCL